MIYLTLLSYLIFLLPYGSGMGNEKPFVFISTDDKYRCKAYQSSDANETLPNCPEGMYCSEEYFDSTSNVCLCDEHIYSEFCSKAVELDQRCYGSSQCVSNDGNSTCRSEVFGRGYPKTCQCQQGFFKRIFDRVKERCTVIKAGLYERCFNSMQCEASVKYSGCYKNYFEDTSRTCQCKPSYTAYITSNKVYRCIINVNYSKSKDMYKAAMVALSCFMVSAIGLIILFLCKRKFLRRNRSYGRDNQEPRRMSDVYNISEGLATMSLCDKPPTYDDVLKTDQMVRGVPPPTYNETSQASRSESSNPRPPATSTGSTLRFAFLTRIGSERSQNSESASQPRQVNLSDHTGSHSNQAFISEA